MRVWALSVTQAAGQGERPPRGPPSTHAPPDGVRLVPRVAPRRLPRRLPAAARPPPRAGAGVGAGAGVRLGPRRLLLLVQLLQQRCGGREARVKGGRGKMKGFGGNESLQGELNVPGGENWVFLGEIKDFWGEN